MNKSIYYEKTGNRPVGEVTDRLISAVDGSLIKEAVYNNLVVDNCSVLIAGLMMGSLTGVNYFAVGSGSPSWKDESMPDPSVSDSKLLSELFRKPITKDDMWFIDDNNDKSNVPTNRIEIKVTFMESEANGALRELGLFGGTASSVKNSGYMINRKIHPLIYKTSGMRLERIIRFTF